MEWMVLPLRRYADFSGRPRPKEYWTFMLGYMLAVFVGWGLLVVAGRLGMAALGLGFIALMIPSLAVQVRRFHDQDNCSIWCLMSAA